jgi:hypothetical protein
VATWKFSAYSTQGDQVWLKSMRFNNIPITRITHKATARLRQRKETGRAYQMDLRRDPVRARDILWARGVEVLKCLEPGANSEAGWRNPGPGQPDVIIGWKDWEWMRRCSYLAVLSIPEI